MFLTDTFTGSAGTALSAHVGEIGANVWALQAGGGVDAVLTDANRVRPNGAAASEFHCSGNPPGAVADYYVEAVVYCASVGAGGYVGVRGRATDGAFANAYLAIYLSPRWELWASGASVANFSQTLVAGTSYTVRLDMVGTTIRVLIDGVQRISVTNSAFTAKGKCGMVLTGAYTNTTGLHLDSISAASTASSFTAAIVCEGDSVTSGINTNTVPWPTQLATDLGAGYTVTNVAASGDTLTGMTASGPTQVDTLVSAENLRNVVVIFGGTNDMFLNADADDTAATTLARLAAYAAARQLVGWEVIVVTMLPRGLADFTTSTLPSVKATHFIARRLAFNASVVANFRTYANRLADVGSDPTMGVDGVEANATYYQADKTHPTNAGALILEAIIRAAVIAEPTIEGRSGGLVRGVNRGCA